MSDVRQALKEEIARLEAKAAKLKEALAVVESADGVTRRKKRTMPPEAIARIRAAKKKWWREHKRKKTPTAS